jgi:hypothetical protein
MNLTEILKNQLGGTSVTEDFPFPPPVGSSRADSPVWVNGGGRARWRQRQPCPSKPTTATSNQSSLQCHNRTFAAAKVGGKTIANGLGRDARWARRLADIHGRVPEARMTAIKIPVRGTVKPDHLIGKRWPSPRQSLTRLMYRRR